MELWQLSESELAAECVSLSAQLERDYASLIAVLAEMESRGSTMGFSTLVSFLVQSTRVSQREARERVALASALPGTETGVALTEGRITREHAVVITNVLEQIEKKVSVEDAASHERQMVSVAEQGPPIDVKKVGQRIVGYVDQDGKTPKEDNDEQALPKRTLDLCPQADGWMKVTGSLDPVTGQLFAGVINVLAQPRRSDPSVLYQSQNISERQGDAFAEIVELVARSEDLPIQAGDSATLLLKIDYQQLMEETTEPVLVGDTFVSWETAKRICCSGAGINPVVFGAEAELKLGRTARTANRAQRRALALRDGGCTFPGCTRRAKWTEPHHIVEWHKGGETELCNQALLCSRHHRIIHHTEWKIVMLDGIPTFFAPKWMDPEQKPLRNTAQRLPA